MKGPAYAITGRVTWGRCSAVCDTTVSLARVQSPTLAVNTFCVFGVTEYRVALLLLCAVGADILVPRLKRVFRCGRDDRVRGDRLVVIGGSGRPVVVSSECPVGGVVKTVGAGKRPTIDKQEHGQSILFP